MNEIPGALGVASHREGKNTLAFGDFSHAEGEETQAQGQSSHAEGGKTAAIGIASHTEGAFTIATGQQAHAEGYSTIAKNFAQHAEGFFNKGESNETVHETGIGLADDDRKNGFEIFTNGDVKAPEQTFESQKNGDGTNLVTVEYSHKKFVSNELIPNASSEVTIDISREINFTIDVNSDLRIERILGGLRGQSGTIMFVNPTLTPKTISLNSYIFYNGGFENQINLDGNFSTKILRYNVRDNENVVLGDNVDLIPHMPIQVNGNGDFLKINNNGDYLVN